MEPAGFQTVRSPGWPLTAGSHCFAEKDQRSGFSLLITKSSPLPLNIKPLKTSLYIPLNIVYKMIKYTNNIPKPQRIVLNK